MQEKIRKEIEKVLPNDDDMPTLDMREQCPFMTAFTQEVMRIRPTAPFALEAAELMGYKIPTSTTVLPFLRNCMLDENVWPEAKELKPERFLDSNNNLIIAKPSQGWTVFGPGKRACPGEKLAMTNLFLIQCRLIQRTRKLGSFYLHLKDGQSIEELLYGDLTHVAFYSAPNLNSNYYKHFLIKC